MIPEFADPDAPSLPLWLIRPGTDGPDLPAAIDPDAANWAKAQGFSGKAGQTCLLPGPQGTLAGALFGLGPSPASGRPTRERFPLARAAESLPSSSR